MNTYSVTFRSVREFLVEVVVEADTPDDAIRKAESGQYEEEEWATLIHTIEDKNFKAKEL